MGQYLARVWLSANCQQIWNRHNMYSIPYAIDTARSVEDEPRNDRRNANRDPEWCGDFSQLQN